MPELGVIIRRGEACGNLNVPSKGIQSQFFITLLTKGTGPGIVSAKGIFVGNCCSKLKKKQQPFLDVGE